MVYEARDIRPLRNKEEASHFLPKLYIPFFASDTNGTIPAILHPQDNFPPAISSPAKALRIPKAVPKGVKTIPSSNISFIPALFPTGTWTY